jgi:hypothetical protein
MTVQDGKGEMTDVIHVGGNLFSIVSGAGAGATTSDEREGRNEKRDLKMQSCGGDFM